MVGLLFLLLGLISSAVTLPPATSHQSFQSGDGWRYSYGIAHGPKGVGYAWGEAYPHAYGGFGTYAPKYDYGGYGVAHGLSAAELVHHPPPALVEHYQPTLVSDEPALIPHSPAVVSPSPILLHSQSPAPELHLPIVESHGPILESYPPHPPVLESHYPQQRIIQSHSLYRPGIESYALSAKPEQVIPLPQLSYSDKQHLFDNNFLSLFNTYAKSISTVPYSHDYNSAPSYQPSAFATSYIR